jgi:hypothetical protein
VQKTRTGKKKTKKLKVKDGGQDVTLEAEAPASIETRPYSFSDFDMGLRMCELKKSRIRPRASGRAVKIEGREVEVGRWIVISLKVSCSLLLLSALA